MRRLILLVVAVVACEQGEASYPDPVGTGGKLTVGGSHASGDGSGSSGESSSAGTGTSDGSGDSSSSGEPMCVPGETCGDEGMCIAVENGGACGHRVPGEPCESSADCGSGNCLGQPDGAEFPGVCTGDDCERIGAECDVGLGTCIADATGPLAKCSHGLAGEACTTDADCVEGICQQYPGEVLLCANPAGD